MIKYLLRATGLEALLDTPSSRDVLPKKWVSFSYMCSLRKVHEVNVSVYHHIKVSKWVSVTFFVVSFSLS
jgi:hypothetical protein